MFAGAKLGKKEIERNPIDPQILIILTEYALRSTPIRPWQRGRMSILVAGFLRASLTEQRLCFSQRFLDGFQINLFCLGK